MTFVLLKPWNGDQEGMWWRWDKGRMKLRNFKGGGFDIDENAEYWQTATIREDCKDWHELYLATGHNQLLGDVYAFDAWISPDGEFYEGFGHAVVAEDIVKLVYGIDVDELSCLGIAEDILMNKHWVKVTRGPMWSYYIKHKEMWQMTQKTYDAVFDFCTLHKLELPKEVEII